MRFCYHWRDEKGVLHFTPDREEADNALHNGYQIFLVMKDERRAK